jgi:hypothetical protein
LLWTADRTAFDESLTAAQRAKHSEAGTQLAQMAARQGSGKGPLAELIRDRQDAAAQVTAIDDRLVEAIGKPTDERVPNEEAEMRAKQVALKRRIAEIDRHLEVEFPLFGSLLSQQPVSSAQIRSVLEPREAVVSYRSVTLCLRLGHRRWRRVDVSGVSDRPELSALWTAATPADRAA